MSSQNGAVQHYILHIRISDKVLMHIFPHFVVAPARKAFVDAIPVAKLFRQQAPLRATTQDPEDSFHEKSAFGLVPHVNTGMMG